MAALGQFLQTLCACTTTRPPSQVSATQALCCRSLPPVGDAVRQVPHKEVPRQVWSLCHGCSWTIPADFVRLHDDKTTFTGECYPGPLLLLLAPCRRCIETGP